MASIYYSLLTNAGAAAMAYAAAHATPVVLSEVALGDGGGSVPAPTTASTALVHEVYRATIDSITVHPDNASWYVVELVIPPETGGFWIREFRIDDEHGNAIYIGNTAPELKPVLPDGMTRDSIYRLIVETSNAATINLVVDPSIVTATHQYVLNEIANHEAKANPHPQYILESKRGAANGVASLDSGGLVPMAQLPSALSTDAEVSAAISAHLAAANPHPEYATDADLAAHAAVSDPHPQYATDADLAAHAAASDPHPQYATDADLAAAIDGQSKKRLFSREIWRT